MEFRTLVMMLVLVTGIGAAPGSASAAPDSPCAPYRAVPDTIAGRSPDRLGTWAVHYDKVSGPDLAITDAINQELDAEARGQVVTYEPSATKTDPWTLNVDGKLLKRPVTVSALFTGEYTTDQPNMPFRTVATRVFDCRSGILIDWDNLFTDKQAGLARLSDQTNMILPTVYAPPTHPGVWQFGSRSPRSTTTSVTGSPQRKVSNYISPIGNSAADYR